MPRLEAGLIYWTVFLFEMARYCLLPADGIWASRLAMMGLATAAIDGSGIPAWYYMGSVAHSIALAFSPLEPV